MFGDFCSRVEQRQNRAANWLLNPATPASREMSSRGSARPARRIFAELPMGQYSTWSPVHDGCGLPAHIREVKPHPPVQHHHKAQAQD